MSHRRSPSAVQNENDHRPRSSKIETALDTSGLILEGLAAAAKLSPLPYLPDAAQLALDIVNLVQDVRNNKDAFRSLANDACELVYAVVLKKVTTPTKEFLDDMRELIRNLTEIEQFAKRQVSRGVVMRTVKRKSDLEQIQEYRQKLDNSVRAFQIKLGIRNEENVAQILAHVLEMREREERRDAEDEAARWERVSAEGKPNAGGSHMADPWSSTNASQANHHHYDHPYIPTPEPFRPVSLPPPPPPRIPVSQGLGRFASSAPLPLSHSSFGNMNISNLGGANNIYSGSVVSFNSGNVSTTINSNSGNDSSVRIYE